MTDEKVKRPAFQFYPGDWRKDVQLRSCSVAARGLWIDLLCVAHECEPYGHLTINGRPMTPAQMAGQMGGITAAQVSKLLAELLDNGVARRSDEGVIYSHRMVKDERIRNARADGGKAGSEHGAKGAEHGAKGGRPKAAKGGSETPLVTPLSGSSKPPPSSSSSSSSSEKPPHSPQGGTSPTSLKAWLEAIKAKSERPIPAGDPVLAYADRVGLPRDYLVLAWQQFVHCYTVARERKRYRDWRQVFRNAVEGNWLKLWYLDASENYSLTTVGHQAQRANDDRKAA